MNLPNHAGLTPFHTLLNLPRSGDILKIFLESNADISSSLPDGRSPLEAFIASLASTDGNWVQRWWDEDDSSIFDSLKRFLEMGADPLTPLPTGEPFAIYFFEEWLGFCDVDHVLGEKLCQMVPTGRVSICGNSILHLLCGKSHGSYWRRPPVEEWMGILLERGANPNLRNHRGQTPLEILLSGEENLPKYMVVAMQLLLNYGADPTLPASSGDHFALQAARRLSSDKIKPLLMADLKIRNGKSQQTDINAASWLSVWDQAVRTDNWTDAKNTLMDWQGYISPERKRRVQHSALLALAEKHLELTMTMYEDEFEELLQVAAILRDCRAEGLEIDMKHIDYLLYMI
jgi:hypothetical protein